jgi:hypothetical protein
VSSRGRARLLLVGILLVCVIVPAVLAFIAGSSIARDQQISQLEERLERVETDVSLLRE